MMKQEFEKLAGRTVTVDQYEAIEKLYMDSDLDKQEFVKSLKGYLKSLPEEHTASTTFTMSVTDNSGYRMTPNHCWYHTVRVELVDVNIKTGKMKVRVIPNSYELRYGYDFWDIEEHIEIVK